MADTPKVYVLCDANCKWEGMTKEQILTAITQAVQNGEITDVDTGFVTTIKTINGTGLKFFVGEQHEYDTLTAEQKDGLFAIITNDTTKEGIFEILTNVKAFVDGVRAGGIKVPRATNAETADRASKDYNGENIHTTYRKIADAVQTIDINTLPSTLLYKYGDNTYHRQVRVTENATKVIGISGKLKVTLAAVENTFSFSVLFNADRKGEICTNFLVNSKVYLVKFNIRLTVDGFLYVSGGLSGEYRYCWNITENAEVGNFDEINLVQLNIFM